MEPIFEKFGIDYYLVGAVARDIQLGTDAGSTRKTNDIDIAILINEEEQFYALKDALIETGNFEAHPTEAIKIFYKGAIEVDLLPFGEIELPNREIRLSKPTPFVINMPGFKEVFPYVSKIQVSEDFTLNVCSLEGIILLKLISNDDKPGRSKDIADIEHIIQVYFELNDTDIYMDYGDVMDLYETQERNYMALISARVLGRKMRDVLYNSPLKERIVRILGKRPTDLWQAMLDGMND